MVVPDPFLKVGKGDLKHQKRSFGSTWWVLSSTWEKIPPFYASNEHLGNHVYEMKKVKSFTRVFIMFTSQKPRMGKVGSSMMHNSSYQPTVALRDQLI